MRAPSFKWFLKKNVKELSYCGSSGVVRLAREAADGNPRLRAPLFLYACFYGAERELVTASSSNEALFAEYSRLSDLFGGDTQKLLDALKSGDGPMDAEYFKVYASYAAERATPERENRLKILMRDRAVELKEEKRISGYKIYKTLGLNPGNANAYLKHGDASKVSLATARRILDFVNGY